MQSNYSNICLASYLMLKGDLRPNFCSFFFFSTFIVTCGYPKAKRALQPIPTELLCFLIA